MNSLTLHAIADQLDALSESWLDDTSPEPHVTELRDYAENLRRQTSVRSCRVCGCTDETACFPPCSWVAPDLCSACSAVAGREVSYEARLVLAAIEDDVRCATDDGVGADLILVATAAGLLGQPEPGTALGLALTRAFDQHQGNSFKVGLVEL
jgi:hypothetical protein